MFYGFVVFSLLQLFNYHKFISKNTCIWKQFFTLSRPPDKGAYLKIIFLISQCKTYDVGTQKNGLNETVLLSIQNTC